MKAPVSFYERQAAQALKRLEALRERGAEPTEDDRRLVAEVLEELSIALQELQVSADELRDQNEGLVSAEGTIAAERERYRELFDFAPDGYLVTDIQGVIRAANRAAGSLLASEPEHLAGKPLAVFMAIELRHAFRTLLGRMADGGTDLQGLETVVIRSDGMSIPAVLHVIAARASGSGERELRWTLRDIRAQRKALDALAVEVGQRERVEEALRHSLALYRHLVEHASDIVYELDEEGRFTFCNEQSTQRILGYGERELMGRKLTDIVQPDWRRSVRAFLARLTREHGKHSYIEFPAIAKDGHEIWLGQHGAAVAVKGRGIAVQAVCRDITAQVRHVGDLERSGEQLRDLSVHLRDEIETERARIAREIHDELGSALTVARMELSSPGEAENGEEIAQRIERVVRRLDNAMESLRRICSDLRPSLLDNMGLSAAIEWLAQDIQQRAGVRCEANLEGLPEDLSPEHATALFRIVQEAVTNAIRHANASKVGIRQRCHGGEIVIEVMDNGRGITLAQKNRRDAYGIIGMLERAKALGGSVQIRGARQGTKIVVRTPLSSGGG